MPAECEKAGGCGVLAVGRCAVCAQAFCASHQGYRGQTQMLNECAPCTDISEGQKRGMAPHASNTEARESEEVWLRDTVRPALLASPTAPWVPLYVHDGWQKKPWRPGLRKRPFDEQHDELGHSVGSGLLIGELEWVYDGKEGSYKEQRQTVLLEHDLEGSPVRPLGGYNAELQAHRVSTVGTYDWMWRGIFLRLAMRKVLEQHAPGVE
ncbi:hypothetical protein SAMN05660359_04758 [Geodermatophilus obscurus]|uniref:Uncharacterized protein n=1 Tax=Geodermatophilus obscurus TaxID=1861 RepID=A0A1I5IP42_9ACTN|nr:hypothetical protein [Geodermatophilus obscurus]SFO62222.1 hypothetical protein SAMN05660359_04758 [Geodermatophilus obscurus]